MELDWRAETQTPIAELVEFPRNPGGGLSDARQLAWEGVGHCYRHIESVCYLLKTAVLGTEFEGSGDEQFPARAGPDR
jgi:hypothetical protein